MGRPSRFATPEERLAHKRKWMREYMREYRAANPEYVKLKSANDWVRRQRRQKRAKENILIAMAREGREPTR